jgi:hypothetical protein
MQHFILFYFIFVLNEQCLHKPFGTQTKLSSELMQAQAPVETPIIKT